MRLTGVLLVVVLLAATTRAEAPVTLVGERVSTSGMGTIDAVLAGAVWSNRTAAADLADTFVLQVMRGEMQSDTSELAVYAAGAGVTPSQNSQPRQSLENATISSLALASKARVLILPLGAPPVAHGAPAGMAFAPTQIGRVTFDSMGNQKHDDLQIDAARAVTASPQHPDSRFLRVEAPFRVVIWNGNFSIRQAGSQQEVSTGESDEPIQGPVPTMAASRHVTREAYLTIEEGTLTLPLDTSFAVFLTGVEVAIATGELEVEAPTGTLPVDDSTIPVGSKLLILDAPLRATMTSADSSIGLAFLEKPTGGTLDGAVRVVNGSPTWLLSLAVFGLVAVPLLGRVMSQGHLKRRLRHLDTLVRGGQYGLALGLARQIRRRRPAQEEARVAEAISLLQGQDYVEAQVVLDEPGWPVTLRPMRAYLLAHALAGQRRPADATVVLESCLRDAPDLRRDAEANPLLAPLLAVHSRTGGRHAVSGAP